MVVITKRRIVTMGMNVQLITVPIILVIMHMIIRTVDHVMMIVTVPTPITVLMMYVKMAIVIDMKDFVQLLPKISA